MPKKELEKTERYRHSGAFTAGAIFIFVVILISGTWFYHFQGRSMQSKTEDTLTSIARLKINQLTAWRQERLGDAAVLMKNPFIIQEVSALLSVKGEESEDPAKLLSFFHSLQENYGYGEILVTDKMGRVYLSTSEGTTDYTGYTSALTAALQLRAPVFTDLHCQPKSSNPHISVIVPLASDYDRDNEPFGFIVLVSNASRFLYPMLQSWPTPSETAETLLIRREENHVLFLNNLRHKMDTALKMKLPLTRTDLPAVMAVEGRKGVVRGRDYRGTEVLAVVMPVPETSWFMVAKIDRKEAFAAWYFRSLLILAVISGIIVLTWVCTLLIRQYARKRYYLGLYRHEADRRAEAERQSTILMSIGDGVIATDNRGLVELMNAAAERLTGWKEEEAIGRPLEEVFSIINEEYPHEVTDPLSLILREGKTVRLANQSILVAKDGRDHPIADSGAPIYDEGGEIRGVVLVFQDQSDERRRQQETEKYRRRLYTLMSNLPGMAYRCRNHENWTMEFVSEGSMALTGYQAEELINDSVISYAQIVHSDYRNQVWEQVQEALRKKEYFQLEYKIVTRDGRIKWVWEQGRGIFSDDGDLLHLEGFITDITDRKEAEEIVRNHHRELEQIFETMPEAMVYTDPQRRIVKVNTAFERIFGYSKNEVIGSETKIIYADPEDYHDQGRKRYNSTSVAVYDSYEIEYRRKSGEVFTGETVGSAIRDSDDNVVGMMGLIRDVTRRKRNEEVIRQSEEKFQRLSNQFQNLLNAIPDSITLLDKDMRIVWANQTAATELGNMQENLVGAQCHKIWHNLEEACSPCPVSQSFADGKQHNCPITTMEGKIWDLISVPLLDEQAEVVNVIRVGRDITEQSRLEEQLRQAQKMESVGRLAGGVAHDYNNMLNVILGYSGLALDSLNIPEPLAGYLKEIQDAARRSSDITRQLLAFARKQTASPQVIDLNKSVESMLKILGKLIGEDIDLTWLPGENLRKVRIDPSQIDQILANLCVNARDAIKGVGKITIETNNRSFDKEYCACHPGFLPGEFVMLAISDNGCGMDRETRESAFDPFFTTKAEGHGTGLGLSTVYGIVKQNQGFINLYSEPDSGTTIRIYFPKHAEQDAEQEQMVNKALPQARGETILLVEDELSILDLGRAMLESLGYTVLTAGIPSEALDIAGKYADDIQLLVTDVIMPGMNGRDLAWKIKKEIPGIDVIFMSGYTDDVILHHGVLDEGVHFIQKPFSKFELAVKVREVLDT